MTPQQDWQTIVATLSAHITDLAAAGQARDAELKAINTKLDALYGALMTPQAGEQGSLLERVARITILVESVSRTGKIVSAIILILGLLGVSMTLGISTAGGK